MIADSELAVKLNRQQQRADGEIAPAKVLQSVCAEFKEYSIPEIKEFRKPSKSKCHFLMRSVEFLVYWHNNVYKE